METVGEIIKRKRKELHLTQAQLAELVGSDEYYISAIETGKRKPGSKFLVSLSNALSVPTDILLGVKSNIALNKQVTAIEEKIRMLDTDDREMLLDIIDKLADRFLEK